MLGTAAYLSPEQARGEEAGPPSDIYSLGVCAYQFLTGRLPHEYASLTELALKQQQDPVDPITDYRPEVPPELDEAVRVALERDPEARYSVGARDGRGDRGRHCAARPPRPRSGSAMSDLAMTQALDDTAATRAHAAHDRARRAPRACTTPSPPAPADAAPRRDERDAARRAANRRRWGTFLALLAAIAGGRDRGGRARCPRRATAACDPVEQPDVQQQIDGLHDFIQAHTR